MNRKKDMIEIFYKMVHPLIKLFICIAYRPLITGKENIPRNGKVVLAGNHTNYLDCLLLMSSISRPIHFLGKHTLFKGKKRILFKAMGVIPVDRTKEKNREAITHASNVLKNGGIVGIFPEGTINRSEELLLPFKMGAVYLSAKNSTPLVPFAITGTYKVITKNKIHIEFLPPRSCSDDLKCENSDFMDDLKVVLERNKI